MQNFGNFAWGLFVNGPVSSESKKWLVRRFKVQLTI